VGFKRQNYSQEILQYLFKNGVVDWVHSNQRGVIISNTRSDPIWYKEVVTPEISQAVSVVAVPVQKPPKTQWGLSPSPQSRKIILMTRPLDADNHC
jgi:hypothetical protein